MEQRSCMVPGTPGCGLVEVPGGAYTQGDSTMLSLNASPAQSGVRVGSFAMDRNEVTVARFQTFWTAGHPSPGSYVTYPGGSSSWSGVVAEPATTDTNCNWGVVGRGSYPVNCITWNTAQAFCVWDGGRLPTESEWEYAARGTGPDPYPWRTIDAPDTRACWQHVGACVVGSYPTGNTPNGIQDLAGNVWEWTADWDRNYNDPVCWNGTHTLNPVCDSVSGTKTIRGGGWDSNQAQHLRSMSRSPLAPSSTNRSVGFRCVHNR